MKTSETENGTIIEVFVKPNSAKFEVVLEDGELVVRCTKEPAKGKVNRELIRELSQLLHAKVKIISGFTSRQKKILVVGSARKEVEQLLGAT